MTRPRIKAKLIEYNEFLLWVVTPRTLRELDERDLTAFSKKHNVSRETLYTWMDSERFVKDIKMMNRNSKVVRLQEVKNAIYETAVLKRDVQAQKLFLNYEEGWHEKSEVIHGVDEKQVAAFEALMANVRKVIKK